MAEPDADPQPDHPLEKPGSTSDAVDDDEPYDLDTLVRFCSCDLEHVYWPNYYHSVGFSCWARLRKVSPHLFVDAQQVYGASLRGRAEVFESCPVGALTIATVLGSIWEAHDLGEQHYDDLELWQAIWNSFAPSVIAFARNRSRRSSLGGGLAPSFRVVVGRGQDGDGRGEEADGSGGNEAGTAEEHASVPGQRLVLNCADVFAEAEQAANARRERGEREREQSLAASSSHLEATAEERDFASDRGSPPTGETSGTDDAAGESFQSAHMAALVEDTSTATQRHGGELQRSDETEDLQHREDEELAAERVRLPWIFDVERFTLLLGRVRRKLDAWLRLIYSDHGDTPTPREMQKLLEMREREKTNTEASSPQDDAVSEKENTVTQAEENQSQRASVSASSVAVQADAQTSPAGEAANNNSLCLCMLFGNGARTFEHVLDTYSQMGLLDRADERFVVYLEHEASSGSDAEEAHATDCWRREVVENRFGLTRLHWHDYRWPDTHIKSFKSMYMRTGKAFASCAMRATAEFILFLEDDWELIARPAQLVHFRLDEAMAILAASPSPGGAGADMVHLRHKLFYGAPYYELLTSVQHNEPPPTSMALYFSEDPVRDEFPARFWSPPFVDDGEGFCDNNRTSWIGALGYQLGPAGCSAGDSLSQSGVLSQSGSDRDQLLLSTSSNSCESPTSSRSQSWRGISVTEDPGGREQRTGREADSMLTPSLSWCAHGSSLVCAETVADHDPFRNLFYTTNPTLYRRKFWIAHFAAIVAVLGDARAIEEAITVSHAWRSSPGYRVAFSPGLFRHKRVDRARFHFANNETQEELCGKFHD